MSFYDFAAGPLLWVVSIIFIIGIAAKMFFFLFTIIRRDVSDPDREQSIFSILVRALFPLHIAALKKPLYAGLFYLFHLCLIIVPIWYSGHIVLWEESRFQWNWTAIPDTWADGLTLVVIGLLICLILRRLFIRNINRSYKWTDGLLFLVTGLPFISGYLLAHGSLNNILFFAENMALIHIMSGEAMILMVVFLFCQTFINPEICTGCAACEINCITGALDTEEKENQRTFSYVPSQCIVCGNCLKTCPEGAVSFKHYLSFFKFFDLFKRKEIRSVELTNCERCGVHIAPVPQIEKIKEELETGSFTLCSECREDDLTEEMFREKG